MFVMVIYSAYSGFICVSSIYTYLFVTLCFFVVSVFVSMLRKALSTPKSEAYLYCFLLFYSFFFIFQLVLILFLLLIFLKVQKWQDTLKFHRLVHPKKQEGVQTSLSLAAGRENSTKVIKKRPDGTHLPYCTKIMCSS